MGMVEKINAAITELRMEFKDKHNALAEKVNVLEARVIELESAAVKASSGRVTTRRDPGNVPS